MSFRQSTNVQVFTVAGANVWTKPAGAKWVNVQLISGGGGGGSGRKSLAGVAAAGGGGGGGGAMAFRGFNAVILGVTETVTVGAGGAGGAAQATNSTNGNPGIVG